MRRSAEIDDRVASANPLPDEPLLPTDNVEAVLHRILATRRDPISAHQQRRARRSRIRVGAPVLAAVLAIAVPAAAVARHFGLVDFSNAGKPIDASKLSLDQTSGWKRAGVTEDVRRLGERSGLVFYLARGHGNNRDALCFSYAAASGTAPGYENLMTCEQAGPDAFPSANTPIVDLSDPMPPAYPNSYPREWSMLHRLVGVAADGVARVGYVDVNGVVHSTSVVDNLYVTAQLGQAGVRAKAIVALDADGRTLYTLDLLH